MSIAYLANAFSIKATGEAYMVARSVHQTGVFGNPYNIATGPTAHVAPVYPYFLSAVMALTGDTRVFKIATTLLAIVLASLLWAAVPLIARWLEVPAPSGIAAGFIGGLSPLRRYVELDGTWEGVPAALSLMFLTAGTYRFRHNLIRPKYAFLAGVLWGLSVLLQPSLFIVVGGVILSTALFEHKRAAAAFLTAIAGFVLTIAPWVAYQREQMGAWMFIRDNLGLELSVSNHVGARPNLNDNLTPGAPSRHPDVTASEALRVRAMGEVAYNRMRMEQALQWIRQEPAEFMRLTLARFSYFWLPKRNYTILRWAEAVLLLFSAAGLYLLWRQSRRIALLIVLIWVLYPPVYYLVQADERYMYPMYWSIVLCAGHAMWSAVCLVQERCAERSPDSGRIIRA